MTEAPDLPDPVHVPEERIRLAGVEMAVHRLAVPEGQLVDVVVLGVVVAIAFDRSRFGGFAEEDLQELAASARRARGLPLVVRLPGAEAATRASWEAWASTLPDVRVLPVGRGSGHPQPIPRP